MMRRMDELHLEYPLAGSRMLRDMLKQDGYGIGRKHVQSLMKKMGIEALQEAITRCGRPDIFNTDKGSQFTSAEFTGVLEENGIQISMDGKGCWRDSVFVERLWRTIKYEEVHLKAYDSVSAAKASLGIYVNFYNTRRPHQSLDGKTPDTIYFAGLPQEKLAA